AALRPVGVVPCPDFLRVFRPSLSRPSGQAGSTAAERVGPYAAAWFVLPFRALLLRPRWAVLGGAVALVLARVLLQAGAWQLYTSSAGVTAGLIFLYGCARTTVRPAAPDGIMACLAVSFLGHLLLDGVDLAWRSGVLPWAVVTALFLPHLLLTHTNHADDPSPAHDLLAPATRNAAPPLQDGPTPTQTEDTAPTQTEDETLASIHHR